MPIMAGLVDLIAAGMGFFLPQKLKAPCGCCGLSLQGMTVCALACGCDGNCSQLHVRRKPALNRLHFLLIPFCQMFFHFCQISLLLRTREGTQAALRSKK